MIVFHVDTGRGWRGGQRQALLLARGLARCGIGSAVATPPGSPLSLRAQAAGLPVFALRVRGDLDLAAAVRLARLARRVGADVLHAHDARAHAVLLLASLLVRRPRRVVTRRTAFPPRPGPIHRLKYGGRIDRYIAISGAVRDGLAAAGVDPARTRVVYSGIDPLGEVAPVDWRARLGLGAEARVLGSLGALTREKGYDDLLPALARIADPRLHLIVLGEGAERRRLEACAAGLGLGGRVHLPGSTDRPRDAMAGFDAYVQPSRAEGLGTSVLDALALGLPLVATTAGGLAEVVEPGMSGLLVPPGDPPALAAALSRLLGDPALRARLAEGGRRRAAAFSAEAMVEGTLAVYRELWERQ